MWLSVLKVEGFKYANALEMKRRGNSANWRVLQNDKWALASLTKPLAELSEVQLLKVCRSSYLPLICECAPIRSIRVKSRTSFVPRLRSAIFCGYFSCRRRFFKALFEFSLGAWGLGPLGELVLWVPVSRTTSTVRQLAIEPICAKPTHKRRTLFNCLARRL
jgi:hypothetical protein